MPPRIAVSIALAILTLLSLAAMPAVVNQVFIPSVGYFPTNTPTLTATSTVTATPTATSAATSTATATPTATSTSTGTPTSTPTATPPVSSGPCSCSGNLYNCSDFSSQGAAQACFDFCVSQGVGDIH